MIIFYNKQTGQIVGTIDGRVHSSQHLNMWIGDKNENDRIVCNWTPKETGKTETIKKGWRRIKREIYEYQPDTQPQIFIRLDRERGYIKNLVVDPKTKTLKEKL